MAHQMVLLESSKEEFKDIRKYIKRHFGNSAWNTVNKEYITAFQRIKNNPEIGNPIEELKALGITNFKYFLVNQTRIVYEISERVVTIHMFIHTRRDFRSQLFKRVCSL